MQIAECPKLAECLGIGYDGIDMRGLHQFSPGDIKSFGELDYPIHESQGVRFRRISEATPLMKQESLLKLLFHS